MLPAPVEEKIDAVLQPVDTGFELEEEVGIVGVLPQVHEQDVDSHRRRRWGGWRALKPDRRGDFEIVGGGAAVDCFVGEAPGASRGQAWWERRQEVVAMLTRETVPRVEAGAVGWGERYAEGSQLPL